MRSPEEVRLFAGPAPAYPLSAEALLATSADGWTLLVLRDDAIAVGIGGFRMRDARTAHLGRLLVDPRLRGRGLGRVLVDLLIGHVAALPGVTQVSLNVYERNAAAVSLYRSLGFIEVERIPGRPPEGWPALRMQRPVVVP